MQFGNWREIWGMERSRCQSFTTRSQEHSSSLANYEPQHKRLEIWVLLQGMKKFSTRLKIHPKPISTEDNSVTWNFVKAINTGHKQRKKRFPGAEHQHGMSGFVSGKGENTQTVWNGMEHAQSSARNISEEDIQGNTHSESHTKLSVCI